MGLLSLHCLWVLVCNVNFDSKPGVVFFFAGLGSFPTSQTQEIKCEEFKHCKVECRYKPTCLPESQCKVEWKIGEGTKTNVEINKRVGVDGNGL